jgi:L-2-hydroxyglutarate oxidase
MEERVAPHTTTRNTGVIHRPFYIDPDKKRVFARSAQKSFPLWNKLATRTHASWSQVGTIEVANSLHDVATLERYEKWATRNGMEEDEFEVLDRAGVKAVEPEVSCFGAMYSKTDTGVYFGELTRLLFPMAQENGVQFLGGSPLTSIKEDGDGVEIQLAGRDGTSTTVRAEFAINVAGGASLDIAHMLSLGREYTDLHFRGEYWWLDGPFALKIRRNIYSIPKNKEYPFLDPHFVVRADGSREIGPNAVLVAGPYTYAGFGKGVGEIVSKVVEPPMMPKINLFTSPKFLSLVASEWRSSLSKTAMCERVERFIPNLRASFLNRRGVAGVRSSLIDAKGFVPEAVEVMGKSSVHILNFNSPGATGAPAFSAREIAVLQQGGCLDFKKLDRQKNSDLWDFQWASDFESLWPPGHERNGVAKVAS